MANVPTRFPMNIAYEFYNKLEKHIDEMHSKTYKQWEKKLKRYYKRIDADPSEEIEKEIEELQAEFGIGILLATRIAKGVADRTRTFAISQVDNQIQAIAGVRPNLRRPTMNQAKKLFVSENVKNIQNIPKDYYNNVSRTIRQGALKGKNINEIREGIASARNKAKNHAKLLSRDQVGNYFAKVTEKRQTQAGIKHYIWASVGDDRVRDTHEEWDGQRFSWKNGSPNGTHPGQEINCRCVAMPSEKEVKMIYGEGE